VTEQPASVVVNRAFQQGQERAPFHWLLEVPEGLQVPHGGQRFVHAAKSGERDRRREVAALFQIAQQFEAIHAWHHQIGHDHIRVKGGQTFQRFESVARKLGFKVAAGKHGGQSDALPIVVVYNKYPSRNGWLSGHILF